MNNIEKALRQMALGNPFLRDSEFSHMYPSMLSMPTEVDKQNADVTPMNYNGLTNDDLSAVKDLKGKPDALKINATAETAAKVRDAIKEHASRAQRVANAKTRIPYDYAD